MPLFDVSLLCLVFGVRQTNAADVARFWLDYIYFNPSAKMTPRAYIFSGQLIITLTVG